MERLFYLSGLVRSGGTVLGSIINQNPDFYVSPTSPLMDIMMGIEYHIGMMSQRWTFDHRQKTVNFLQDAFRTYYKDVDKKYIIDNHKGWPTNIGQIKKDFDMDPRVICLYRPLPEIIASFMELIKRDPKNAVDQELKKNNKPLTVKNRAMLIWDVATRQTWEAFNNGLTLYPQHIHLVKYDDLCGNPQETVNGIYDFLGVPHFAHDFENIENTLAEDHDEVLGFKNLHNIRTSLKKTSIDPKEVLGEELVKYFEKYDKLLRLPK